MPRSAKIAGKRCGESVEREYAARLHQFDVSKQIVIVSVIGKGKCCIDMVTINRIGVDGPTTDHRHTFARDFLQHLASGLHSADRSTLFRRRHSGCIVRICKTIGQTVRRYGSSGRPSRAAWALNRPHRANRGFPALCLTNSRAAPGPLRRQWFRGRTPPFDRPLILSAESDSAGVQKLSPSRVYRPGATPLARRISRDAA